MPERLRPPRAHGRRPVAGQEARPPGPGPAGRQADLSGVGVPKRRPRKRQSGTAVRGRVRLSHSSGPLTSRFGSVVDAAELPAAEAKFARAGVSRARPRPGTSRTPGGHGHIGGAAVLQRPGQGMAARPCQGGGEAAAHRAIDCPLRVDQDSDWPRVRVPVLSKTTVSTSAEPLQRAGRLEQGRHWRISRPLAITWTAGTAKPRAQGQVMIRTLTAISRASPARASPTASHQPRNVANARHVDHRGIEPGDAVGQRDVAGLALLGRLHEPDDLAQQRVLAHRRHPDGQGGGLVEGAGKDLGHFAGDRSAPASSRR